MQSQFTDKAQNALAQAGRCARGLKQGYIGTEHILVGLLKEELRRCGSLIMEAADATRVPAGSALAVGRENMAARQDKKDEKE